MTTGGGPRWARISTAASLARSPGTRECPAGCRAAAGGPPSGFMNLQTSSFADFLASHSPGLLPGRTVPGRRDPGNARPGHPRPAARHHHRGRRLRRRGGAGRRPPGHRREHDREAGRGEGLPQRRVLRHGLRGHRQRGDRVRPAVPGRARALREDGGPVAVPGGQGEPPGLHGQGEPRGGHAGPRRGAAVRRLRRGLRARADLQLRRGRRPVRGAAGSTPSARGRCSPAAR